MQDAGSSSRASANIRAAFPATPINLKGANSGGLDGGTFGKEADSKTWVQLDAEFLGRRSDALSFLAPHHIAAVLPAYLTMLVERGTNTAVPDTLTLVLNRADTLRFSALFCALTESQRGALEDALDAFADMHPGPTADAAFAASRRWKSHS